MPADFKQGTNLVGKILASGRIAGTTNTTLYTVPAATATKVATFVLANPSGAAVNLAVSVVPSGGTVDGTHVVLPTYSLAAGDSIKVSEVEGAMLDAGAFISVIAGTAASVTYLLTGAESS